MKKPQIFLATIIICCLFLWIGFYAWWSTKTVTTESNSTENVEQSLFDKQAKCNSYYETYKDKLSYANSDTSSLEELSVSYSQLLDNCIASWIVSYKRWDSTTYNFNIVNASRWDQKIFSCYIDMLEQDDKCWMNVWRNKLYDLTYSDIIEKY